MSKWTPEIIDALKALMAQKLSSSVVADNLNAEFGCGLTRNAVIGKCHRMAIAMAAPAVKKPLRDRGAAGFVTVVGSGRRMPMLPRAKQPKSPRTDEPEGLGYTILILPSSACKWPQQGKGKDMLFCGHKTDATYCGHHADRAYQRKQEDAA